MRHEIINYLFVFLFTVLLLAQELIELQRSDGDSKDRSIETHVDQRLRNSEEVLTALILATLGVPIKNGLVGNTVLVVQHLPLRQTKKSLRTKRTHLEHLREDLHNFTLLVAIQLNSVDECDLRLAAITKRFENLGEPAHFPGNKTETISSLQC